MPEPLQPWQPSIGHCHFCLCLLFFFKVKSGNDGRGKGLNGRQGFYKATL